MKIHKIVCPTDFSEQSYYALNCAEDLATEEGEIVVVHVEPAMEGIEALLPRAPFAETAASRRAEAVNNLCAVLNERLSSKAHVRPVLRQGDAALEIVRTAREEAADLIVMTPHGAGQYRAEFLGCVATEVIRTAPCPVLIVNSTDHAQDKLVMSAHRFDIPAMRPAMQVVSPHAVYLDGD